MLTLAGLTCAASLLHLRPLILWSLQIEPALRAEPHAERLRVSKRESFAASPGDWVSLRVGDLRLAAPIPVASLGACEACIDHCLLSLENGTLAVLPDRAPDSFQEMLDTFGPDERDLSPLRSRQANWATIDAIVGRVLSSSPVPDAFRFEAPGSKGLVTRATRFETEAFVVYPYSHAGEALRVIGVAGLGAEDALRIIGSIVGPTGAAHAPLEGLGGSDCGLGSSGPVEAS